MFFYLSKIAAFFIQPSNFLIALVVFGLVMSMGKRLQKWGRRFIWVGAIGLIVCGFSPAANLLIQPLEDRFSRPAELVSYDGVIILGGAVDTVVTGARGETALTVSGERLTIAARLAKLLPEALIIHTGGQGTIITGQATESEGASRLFDDFGIVSERIVLEDESRNTWENAVLTKKLVDPKPGQTWLLVTSAYHMPRSMGVFEAAGWSGVTAYPVDYRTRGGADWGLGFDGASKGLRRVDIGVREWIGLAVYWLTGRSSALFPGPVNS
ncbi:MULTISPECIES: YdcF family protein [unclassified Roseibium]|uniref:YdcF family protein n=1 Tax=unclassified Roseibium TaxID=2629323 RepID=UPI00273EF126|nr:MULTISPECIES: YdcF family protein [unclassified Roseibium]